MLTLRLFGPPTTVLGVSSAGAAVMRAIKLGVLE